MATIELIPAAGSAEPPSGPPRSLAPPPWGENWRDYPSISSPELEHGQGELWHTVQDLAEDLGISDEQMTAATELAEQMNESHPPLCSHCLRVGLLTIEAADFLGVDRDKAFLAGLLHDVGKISVRSKTLKKTTRFSFEDTREMNKHSRAGYDILSNYKALPSELPLVVGTHHKRQLNNANGMAEHALSSKARRLRDAVTIADFVDASFRHDGRAEDSSPTDQAVRILEHINYVLAQETYNYIENKTEFAKAILDTLLRTRVNIGKLSETAYA